MSFVFFYAHNILINHKYFKINDVMITGCERISPDAILELTQIKKGLNIFSVNLVKSKKQAKNLDWIENINFERSLPNRVFIKVKEYKPLAIINILETDKQFIIDESGKIFKIFQKADNLELPVFSGISFLDIDENNKISQEIFSELLNIFKLDKELKINKINFDKETGMTLYLNNVDLKALKLGFKDYLSKYEYLKKSLSYLKQVNRPILSKLKYIDYYLEIADLTDKNRIILTFQKYQKAD